MGEEKRRLHPPQVSSNFMASLSISLLIKTWMSRRLNELLISCMAQLGRCVAEIMALVVLGLIFPYSFYWNDNFSSGLENCLARILWKDPTVLTNWPNASSLSSVLLEMSLLYSCFCADQTVAIRIKSREGLMLSTHAFPSLSRLDYVILVQNTWEIWCLKENGTKRGKISGLNIYPSKGLFNSK